MYVVKEDFKDISFEVSSQLSNIDRVVADITSFIQNIGDFAISSLIQVIRELMLNAMEHGNGNDSHKMVFVTIVSLDNNRVMLTVADEGTGVPDNTIPVKRTIGADDERSRGLSLVNSLADELSVSEDGKVITVYLPLLKEFEWGVDTNSDETVIKPSKDISASYLEGLRSHLFEWLDGSSVRCVLDLSNVNSIDSVTLSLLVLFSKHLNVSPKKDQFSIVNVSPDMAKLFKLTQLFSLFTIEEK